MAFISSGYNPAKPMENRITDIGPKHFEQFAIMKSWNLVCLCTKPSPVMKYTLSVAGV